MHPNADICTWPEGPEAFAEDRKGCFPCKLRGWSENGLSATFRGGREHFHDGPSNREWTKRMFEGAKRLGNKPPEPVGGYASGGPAASALGN